MCWPPGVVAGLLPWWLTGWQVRHRQPSWAWAPLRVAGGVLIAAGVVVLVPAFVRFVAEGAGTPAPVTPTEHLVVGGLYRYVRNPMYLAVVATIVGQALALGQPALLGYAAAVGAAMAAFVHAYEEPTLHRQFGAQYQAYRRAVPAWWPRRKHRIGWKQLRRRFCDQGWRIASKGGVHRRIQRRCDPLPLPRQHHPDPLDPDTSSHRLTSGHGTWRARCSETTARRVRRAGTGRPTAERPQGVLSPTQLMETSRPHGLRPPVQPA